MWQKGLCRCDQSKDLRWEIIGLSDEPSEVTRVLISETQSQSQRKRCEDGGGDDKRDDVRKGPRAKKCWQLPKMDKQGRQFLSESFQKEHSPADTLIL